MSLGQFFFPISEKEKRPDGGATQTFNHFRCGGLLPYFLFLGCFIVSILFDQN